MTGEAFNAFLATMSLIVWGAWWLYRRSNPPDSQDTVGELDGIRVTLAPGDGGRLMVGMAFSGGSDNDIVIRLPAREARRLAEMIRIAATPGRTLAVARASYRRKKGPADTGPLPS